MRYSKYVDQLLGELIGLARATDGNEHLINPAATGTILKCLEVCAKGEPDSAVFEEMMCAVLNEKKKMVPDCFLCASPCGKNNAFSVDDMQLDSRSVQESKESILRLLFTDYNTFRNPENERLLYQALVVIGILGIDVSDLDSFKQELFRHIR